MGMFEDDLDNAIMNYEDSIELALDYLAKGYHTQRTGQLIKITSMKDSHLYNSIRFGNKHGGEYWASAVIRFQAEVERREAVAVI